MATGQVVVEQEDVGLWFWCYQCEIAWPDDIERGQVCPKCDSQEEIASYFDSDWHGPEETIV